MITSVELFIGLRYLRTKRRTRFVSFITLISLLGVALGVAALIVILSVMNGFETELRSRLLSMSAHGSLSQVDGATHDWRQVAQRIEKQPQVLAAAPLTQLEGMIQADGELFAVLVNGVDPELEARLSGELINMIDGDLGVLQSGERSIILGRSLAFDLRVRIGDSVVLLVPTPTGDGTLEPVLERFVLRGVFEAGEPGHDGLLALVHLDDVAAILELGDAVSAVRFRVADVMQAPDITKALQDDLGDRFKSSDWTIENASYFRAIRLEKTMMSILLSLIIAVAAFNIVASLVMVVTDKTTDIAVLRTLGLGPQGVVRVFFVQGAMIGWLGVLIGVTLGVLVAVNVTEIVAFIEWLFRFQVMPRDVYYVTRIPTQLEWQDVTVIAAAAFFLTSIATLYPARRAALVNPAAALRYE